MSSQFPCSGLAVVLYSAFEPRLPNERVKQQTSWPRKGLYIYIYIYVVSVCKPEKYLIMCA